MEMCTFEQYLKEPYALDFQQMQKIHGELLKEIEMIRSSGIV